MDELSRAPERPPLDAGALAAGLAPPWTGIDVRAETESTNADLTGPGAPAALAGRIVAAEFQRAGRGRLDRAWSSPPRAGLTFSALVRPPVPPHQWGWLPLLTGVALCDAVGQVTGLDVSLKWPNDLLAPGSANGAAGTATAPRKLAGILVQAAGGGAVIGVGLNVSTTRAELPVPTATSLAIEGGRVLDRTVLLGAILGNLGRRYLEWVAAGGDADAAGLAGDYRDRCSTLGQLVTVTGAGGADQRGRAVGIDTGGRLLLQPEGTEDAGTSAPGDLRAIAAGDIVHLRGAAGGVG